MMGPEIQHPVVDFSTWVVRNGRTHPGYKLPMMKYTPEMLSDAQLQGIFAFLAAQAEAHHGRGAVQGLLRELPRRRTRWAGSRCGHIAAEPVNVFIMDTPGRSPPG